jgi:hypothetical protein
MSISVARGEAIEIDAGKDLHIGVEALPQQVMSAVEKIGQAEFADVGRILCRDERLAVCCGVLIIAADGQGPPT